MFSGGSAPRLAARGMLLREHMTRHTKLFILAHLALVMIASFSV
jgi:hypothetical protein